MASGWLLSAFIAAHAVGNADRPLPEKLRRRAVGVGVFVVLTLAAGVTQGGQFNAGLIALSSSNRVSRSYLASTLPLARDNCHPEIVTVPTGAT
jgi:hypothetical protein